ncbi:DNA polymerase III subunit gamma/tau [Thermodesulfobacteriota bacterium]
MSYLVLARKYRPQTFDQVVQQDHVTRTLANAISADRVAHAILFSGPRGTGKTTVARILAKAMNCETGPAKSPCNGCRSCVEITSGSGVDVFEIDGASNNSVDQVRELRENVKYMPAHSLYKIYIIDEVHMLSVAAFNALLKTLEEPPSHVMFIFATTEPHKIPITILSRCQRHDFRRIDVESMLSHMEFICDREGISIPLESLGLISREAGGSMRDALSLLDQVILCAEDTIHHDHVIDILGVVDRKVLFDISNAVIQGDVTTILDIIDEIYDHGHDMKKLYAELVEQFRNLLVVKMAKKLDKLVNIPTHEIDMMRSQVKNVSLIFLNQMFDLLVKEEAAIRLSSQPKLAMEMIFIRMFQIKPALPIDALIEKLDNLKKDIYEGHASPDNTETEPVDEKKPGNLRTAGKAQTGTAESVMPFNQTTSENGEDLEDTCNQLLTIISEQHPSLAANLKNSVLKEIDENRMVIEVKGNGYNINMINRSDSKNTIKKVCREFFGRNMDVVVKTKTEQDNERRHISDRASRLRKEALNHSLVADAIEIFDGKVIDVKIKP